MVKKQLFFANIGFVLGKSLAQYWYLDWTKRKADPRLTFHFLNRLSEASENGVPVYALRRLQLKAWWSMPSSIQSFMSTLRYHECIPNCLMITKINALFSPKSLSAWRKATTMFRIAWQMHWSQEFSGRTSQSNWMRYMLFPRLNVWTDPKSCSEFTSSYPFFQRLKAELAVRVEAF